MSIKLLAMPFLVICTLVIAISYVKPDVALLFAKQHRLEQLRIQSSSLDTISSNVKSMQSQITTSQSDSTSTMTDADFLRQVYFPASSDIEKGIDQLNFLADQSGVVVSTIEVEDAKKEIPVATAPEESMQTSADLLIAKKSDSMLEEVNSVAVHRTYTPKMFAITIRTVGSYEATKDFYARLVQAKRFFLPETVKLAHKEDAGAINNTPVVLEKDTSGDSLVSDMVVHFFILPTVSISSAIGDDAFEKSKLDFETLAMIRQNLQGVTPELPAANPLGKTNPFIK